MTPRTRGRIGVAVMLSALAVGGAGVCWWATRPAEVRGRERARQDRVDARFDEAFSRGAAAPPPRALDAGAVLLDDAGTR